MMVQTMKSLSKFLDNLSNFFAHRKGLLIIVGILLITINLVITIFSSGWLANNAFFLHVGLIIALIGILLSWAL
jgi:hypothetical protein